MGRRQTKLLGNGIRQWKPKKRPPSDEVLRLSMGHQSAVMAGVVLRCCYWPSCDPASRQLLEKAEYELNRCLIQNVRATMVSPRIFMWAVALWHLPVDQFIKSLYTRGKLTWVMNALAAFPHEARYEYSIYYDFKNVCHRTRAYWSESYKKNFYIFRNSRHAELEKPESLRQILARLTQCKKVPYRYWLPILRAGNPFEMSANDLRAFAGSRRIRPQHTHGALQIISSRRTKPELEKKYSQKAGACEEGKGTGG